MPLVSIISRRVPLCLIFLVLGTLAACAGSRPPHTITQVSTISALMLGQYRGHIPVRDLLRAGDFGIGTFDHLDGEMILLDGVVYQAAADGSVRRADSNVTTPFAVVTRFAADDFAPSPAVGSLEELEAHIDALVPAPNTFLAIRVEADFDSLTMRSVPRQSPPFPPLTEVVKHQSLWTHGRVTGTLVGFRSPQWVNTINVPGYHWHFISHDRQLGGHVMDIRFHTGIIATQLCHDWHIHLDPSADTQQLDLTQDMHDDLNRVERLRGPTN